MAHEIFHSPRAGGALGGVFALSGGLLLSRHLFGEITKVRALASALFAVPVAVMSHRLCLSLRHRQIRQGHVAGQPYTEAEFRGLTMGEVGLFYFQDGKEGGGIDSYLVEKGVPLEKVLSAPRTWSNWFPAHSREEVVDLVCEQCPRYFASLEAGEQLILLREWVPQPPGGKEHALMYSVYDHLWYLASDAELINSIEGLFPGSRDIHDCWTAVIVDSVLRHGGWPELDGFFDAWASPAGRYRFLDAIVRSSEAIGRLKPHALRPIWQTLVSEDISLAVRIICERMTPDNRQLLVDLVYKTMGDVGGELEDALVGTSRSPRQKARLYAACLRTWAEHPSSNLMDIARQGAQRFAKIEGGAYQLPQVEGLEGGDQLLPRDIWCYQIAPLLDEQTLQALALASPAIYNALSRGVLRRPFRMQDFSVELLHEMRTRPGKVPQKWLVETLRVTIGDAVDEQTVRNLLEMRADQCASEVERLSRVTPAS